MEEDIKRFHWPNEVDIPPEFHSIDDLGEFTRCIMCDKKVKESEIGEPYLIERSFQKVNDTFENVLFEYAMCLTCAQQMNEVISKDSKAKMEEYFSKYISPANTAKRMEEGERDEMAWFSKCVVKGTARTDIQEYNICGLFRGDKMLVSELPYLLSMEAMEELTGLLSAKTKDEMDDFRKNNLKGPPEFEELLKGRPVLVF